jgi:PAS domain S-box-containing protein
MEKPEISKIESESIYKAFISTPLQSIFVIDPDFNILDFNEVALEKLKFLYPYPPQKGESFLNLVQPENLEKTKKDLELALLGTPVSGIKQLRGIKKGHSYSTQFGYTPLKDNRGSVICLVLAYQDVTAENLANTRAEQFSSLLDLLFEQSHEGLLVVDLSNLDFKANPEFYRIFDLDNHQLTEEVGRILAPVKWDFSFPFSVKQSLAIPLKKDVQFQVLRSGVQPTFVKIFRNELVAKSGSKILLLSVKDETEVVLAERDRIETELSFKTVAKNFPNGNITIIDKNLNIVFSDGIEFETDLGVFQPKIGQSILNQYGQNYGEYIKDSLLSAFQGVSEQFELKFQEKTFSMVVTPMPEKTGKINLVMKIAQNVSLQKNAQLEAHYSREYLRQVIDVDPNFIYVKSKEGSVIMANKSVANFFGTTVKDFIKNSSEYFKTYKWRYEEIMKLDDEIFKTLKTKTSEEAIFNKETKKMHLFQITRTPFVSEGNELSILCVGVDITDRVNAENELITQREYLRHILDTDPNFIFVKDSNGKFLLVNKAFADYYETTVEEIIGKKDETLSWPESDWRYFESSDKEVIQTNEQLTIEKSFINPLTNVESFFVTTKKPLLDADGNINILGVVTDLTNQKRQEEKIRKSEELLQEIFNRVADALFTVDFKTLKITDCNHKAVEMLQIPEKQLLIGRPITSVKVKDDLKNQFWSVFFKDIHHTDQSAEAEVLNGKNQCIWGSLAATIFNQDGRDLVLLRIADISAQKNSEDQIKNALHEKEILIQEIHHRVKNNMAVISSLLQLQTGYIKDPALIDVFKDSQSRIKSMALIHEKLYQSKTLAKVEMESYIKELARTLLFTYNSRRADIRINTFVDNVFLDINSAVPCGLVINEIISNACKHAFVGLDSGVIEIHFSKHENQYVLELKDNGVGLPANTNFSDFKSLGMSLVHALSSQLGAHLEIKTNTGQGLSFNLSFIEKIKPNRSDISHRNS